MRSRTAGAIGVTAAALFVISAIISAATFENGVYSLLNCFVTELGAFTHTYLTLSPALVFNVGIILSGLLTAAFMVMYGVRKDSAPYTAVSFFGLMTGLLIAAQGIFTFNYGSYHYICKAAFSVSAFLTCALYVAAQLRFARGRSGFAGIMIAFFAGIVSAVFAAFALAGGVENIIAQDMAGAARLKFLPFAAVEWAEFMLLFAFISFISVKALISRDSDTDFNEETRPLYKPGNRGLKI